MSEPYSETLAGLGYFRQAPDELHEIICARLHAWVTTALEGNGTTRLLPARTQVTLTPDTVIRPDLALVTAATDKLWLAAEIVSRSDHRVDTVVKKEVYEFARVPRLWMVDPRYDNVEVYHGSPHGLALRHILACREELQEALIPALRVVIAELFAAG